MRGDNFLLAEGSIFINVDLCVDAVNIKVWCDSPRINLNLCGINFNKHVIEALELLDALGTCFVCEVQVINNLLGVFLRERLAKRETKSVDCTWIFCSYCFDVHASLLGVDAAEALVLTIVQEGQVDLSVDIDSLVHKDRCDRETSSCGLMGNKIVANHSLCLFGDLLC